MIPIGCLSLNRDGLIHREQLIHCIHLLETSIITLHNEKP